MPCSLKHYPWCPPSSLLRPRLAPLPPLPISASPAAQYDRPCLYLKPLHLNPAKEFLSPAARPVFQCSAESNRRSVNPVQQKILDLSFWDGPLPDGGFARCFAGPIVIALNYVAYKYSTKICITRFPYPWFASAYFLASGFLHTVKEWLKGTCEVPDTDPAFWISLFPVAFAHAVGYVATMVTLSNSSISFTGIMRCAEPVFTLLLSSLFILRGRPSRPSLYLSLLPIIGGCALTALTEPNFNMTAFVAAMIANFAFASMNIVSDIVRKEEDKKEIWGREVQERNYSACLSILSFLLVAPYAFAFEGPRLWSAGWKIVTSTVPMINLYSIVLMLGVVYGNHLELVYRNFPHMDPFPFFTISTLKKIFLVIFSFAFTKPFKPINALAAAMAILGFSLHTRELCKVFPIQSWYL